MDLNSDFNLQEEGAENQEASVNPGGLVLVSEVLPDRLLVVPVRPRPVFPNNLEQLMFKGMPYVEAIREASEKDNRLIGLALVREENRANFFQSVLYDVGTVAKIYKVNQVADDTVQVFCQGLNRFQCIRCVQSRPYARWEVKYHYEQPLKPSQEQKAKVLAIMDNVKNLVKQNPMVQEQMRMVFSQISYDKSHVILDLVTNFLTVEPEQLQELLETFDFDRRADKLLLLLKSELDVASIREEIQKQIETRVSEQQREFFLKEQLKVIKKELGLEKDDKTALLEKLRERTFNLTLSDEAAKVIGDETRKLEMLDTGSPEFQVTSNYLDTLTQLPWGFYSEDNLNIRAAKRRLNKGHYGLETVKRRILEFIATMKKRGSLTGSILCLVGPPGVGKSSIGRAVADALGRKFYRFSLGGMRDESEIKGHRRTYIGAMPGKIIQSLMRVGTANPVIMLDEIDKLGQSYQGDPASALLEVLDPELNRDFLDHYIDVRFDLRQVLFITTANQLDTIPEPLLDRMELIRLSGYLMEEKMEIAKRHLLPRQLAEHGLTEEELRISDAALRTIADKYAREAGVRSLENQIRKIIRGVNLKLAEGRSGPYSVEEKDLEEYLGKPLFPMEELYEKEVPGISLGLAWTAMGGATLYIEASAHPSAQASFRQTGQLGNVMRESAEIAYSYVRSLMGQEAGDGNFFDKHAIHLHVPAGATPKDGPSAGITMGSALYSLAKGIPLRRGLAMTGELTLSGKVLPIGGVREKCVAAKRAGIGELIFPEANRSDVEELPVTVRRGLKFHFVAEFEQVIALLFASGKKPSRRRTARKTPATA
jgi:ATP-dependent Lon protease